MPTPAPILAWAIGARLRRQRLSPRSSALGLEKPADPHHVRHLRAGLGHEDALTVAAALSQGRRDPERAHHATSRQLDRSAARRLQNADHKGMGSISVTHGDRLLPQRGHGPHRGEARAHRTQGVGAMLYDMWRRPRHRRSHRHRHRERGGGHRPRPGRRPWAARRPRQPRVRSGRERHARPAGPRVLRAGQRGLPRAPRIVSMESDAERRAPPRVLEAARSRARRARSSST